MAKWGNGKNDSREEKSADEMNRNKRKRRERERERELAMEGEASAKHEEQQPAMKVEEGGGKKRKKQNKRKKYKLVSYEELPAYMKENEFILNYYRAEWPILNAFLSLFSIHNETVNVWTHFLGFLLFLGLTLMHLSYSFPQVAGFLGHLSWPISQGAMENVSSNVGNFIGGAASLIKLEMPLTTTTSHIHATRWPFFVFLGGAMFCLLCSSACHLLCCHSHKLNLFLNRLDYAGIAVMIAASFFPPVYYVFQCSPHWQIFYLSTISAAGVATVIALLSPHMITGKFRAYRALLFGGMAFSGIVPGVHAVVVNWNEPRRNVTLAYEVAMAASYVTGTVFYVTRVPERWKPGMFDLAGHSHQIFHVLVIAGAVAHYGAAVMFLQFRDAVGCS